MKFLSLFFSFFLSLLFAQSAITPIPLTSIYDEEKAELGKELFFDTILSEDGRMSCVSCHILPGNGADNVAFSVGLDGHIAKVNTPTVLNAVYNFSQFWDGRAEDLHEQALMPIFNPDELGSSIEEAIERLTKSPYKKKFSDIYADGVTQKNIADLLGEFEKALITPNSRFDQYLRGDEDALSEKEKKGYKTFQDLGCIACHNGVNIGGNMYQKIGVMVEYDYPDANTNKRALDGRYNVTLRQRDKRVFKVPSLRNIALTAPYLHDGSAKSLRDAIIEMREHQLGILEKNSEIEDIEMFLKTLNGEAPKILEEMK